MEIGNKIREYRLQKNLTQKELAELLNVTGQAVSRWENEGVEPSFDCLKKMAEIFECSIDELFGLEKKEDKKPDTTIIIKEEKQSPVLCLCEKCNSPIFDKQEICRFTEGKAKYIYCKNCFEKKVRDEFVAASAQNVSDCKKRFVRSFVYPTILFVVLIAVFIYEYLKDASPVSFAYLAAAFLGFFFLACIFLQNNFIGDVWLEIASWGFVKLPGVIFEFSLDGFIIGIAIKIILWLLGFALAALSVLFATAVGTFLSIFVYPFAIAKNRRELSENLISEEDILNKIQNETLKATSTQA